MVSLWGRSAYRVLVDNMRGRDHWEDLGVDVRIILKRIFKQDYGVMNWITED